jgi:hypothetical protein
MVLIFVTNVYFIDAFEREFIERLLFEVYSVESRPAFNRNLSPLSTESKKKPNKKPEWKQNSAWHILHFLAYFSILNMAIYFSETSVDFRNCRCGNLKSYICCMLLN